MVERQLSQAIDAPGLPAPAGHYTPAVRAGEFIFVSGQLPQAPSGTAPTDMPFAEQSRQVLERILTIAAAAGAGPEDIAKVTVFLADVGLWGQFNRIYANVFGAVMPARSVVPVPALHHGYLVEVEAIAFRPTPAT